MPSTIHRPHTLPVPDTTISAGTAPTLAVSSVRALPPFARVPAGPACIGCDEGFPDEAPAHIVDVPTFAIGIYPVTNRDYAAFLADTGAAPPPYWGDARLNQADQPLVGVTWVAAQVYCRWLAGAMHAAGLLRAGQVVRLPTEAEWEKAASWNPGLQQARRYPWGNQWNPTRAVTAATRTRFPLPITSARGSASAYGVHGMLGNIWEWTASVYQSYPGAAQPFAEPNRYVIRGGSCALRPPHLRCSYRCRLPPHAWRYHLGFRVVIAAPLASGV